EPDEIVQEVWLRVLARLDDLEADPKKFRAWVLGIARNVLFEMSRSAHAEERARGADLAGEDRWESFFARQQDQMTAVSVGIARQDMLHAFLGRIDKYGEVERRLLVLRGLEGRAFDEIAEELQLTRDVAAKRWQRLRDRLQLEGVPEYLV
ncbi:MAG: RNA polymerase sigma factor (sigma-70 family), partial [Planctomycetota bacterium]